MASAATARATVINVDSLRDVSVAGHCTLRNAIDTANGNPDAGAGCAIGTGNDIVNLQVTGTIKLNSALPTIEQTLTINGSIVGPITISGEGASAVMSVDSGAVVTLNGLTIANGLSASDGGGIDNGGVLTIDSCTLSNNAALEGGAIFNDGTLTVTRSTLAGNSAGNGSAISNGGILTLLNSTIANNSAASNKGAIWSEGTVNIAFSTFFNNDSGALFLSNGTITLQAVILARGGASGADCSATTFNDIDFNIADDASCGFTAPDSLNGTDPFLDAAGLKNNRGPTQTIALDPNSDAIGRVPVANCLDADNNALTVDQRGVIRPSLNHLTACDSGAYEDSVLSTGGSFAVLATDGKVTLTKTTIANATEAAGGKSIVADKSNLAGDAVANPGGINLKHRAEIQGQCVSDGAKIVLSKTSHCDGGTDLTGTNPLLQTLQTSEIDLFNFGTLVQGLTATQTLGKIALKKNKTQTIIDSVTPGLNIVDATNIQVGAKSTLTLQGGPTDFVILRVAQKFSLGAKGKLALAGGLLPSNVLIMVGGATTIGMNASLAGAVLSPTSACTVDSGSTIAGAILCDKKVTMTGVTENYVSPDF